MDLTQEEAAFIERCQKFAEGYLKDNFKRYDDLNCFAEDVHAEAFQSRLLHGSIPREWGGQGLRHTVLAKGGAIMAKVCAPTTFSMGFNHGTMRPILQFGSDEQKQNFVKRFVQERRYISWCMTEPDISGSNLFDIKSTATKTPNGWYIEGSKCMIGNGTKAELYLVLARTIEDGDFQGLSIFLVPRDDSVRVSANPKKLGFHSLPTPTVQFSTTVPEENVLGGIGFGVDVLMDSLDYMRFGGGIILLGLCQGALQDIKDFTSTRQVYGGLLCEKSHIQINVGRLIAEAMTIEQLLGSVARALDEGRKCPKEAAALKLLGSSLAQTITSEAVQILGWRGIDDDYPIQKRYRDARQATIYEGTNEILAINLFNSYIQQED